MTVLEDFFSAMSSGINPAHVYQHLGASLCLWILVIAAVLIDLWDGVYTAKTIGQRIHSHKLRVTIRKIGEYWRFILMGFVADTIGVLFPFWAWPYLSILICLAIVCIEGKSILEHAKRRRSHVSEIPDMIGDIIHCVTEHDALEVIKRIKDTIDEENTRLTHNKY